MTLRLDSTPLLPMQGWRIRFTHWSILTGVAMDSRYEDCPRLNFSQIESCEDVRFAHKRGFVAKVEATDPARLKELLALAVVKPQT